MLKTSTDLYKFKLINKKIFRILGDQITDFEFYQFKGYFMGKPGKFRKIMILFRKNFVERLFQRM
jgi:hypothetical protein